jgi:hypothetical protein
MKTDDRGGSKRIHPVMTAYPGALYDAERHPARPKVPNPTLQTTSSIANGNRGHFASLLLLSESVDGNSTSGLSMKGHASVHSLELSRAKARRSGRNKH